jgi:hypothetical protein
MRQDKEDDNYKSRPKPEKPFKTGWQFASLDSAFLSAQTQACSHLPSPSAYPKHEAY